jgi:putative Holliday junction resolvase
MECLGIDYGERRIGMAWGNSLGVATPLPAANQADVEARLQQIAEVIQRRRISRLVVGYPYNMDGSVGFKAREVDAFIAVLEQRFGLPVERVDERLTSHQAKNDLGLRGRSERKVRAAGVIDSAAACLILQDWLDANLPAPLLADEATWD